MSEDIRFALLSKPRSLAGRHNGVQRTGEIVYVPAHVQNFPNCGASCTKSLPRTVVKKFREKIRENTGFSGRVPRVL